jgi:peptide/nickel transport system substrate-binding protein
MIGFVLTILAVSCGKDIPSRPSPAETEIVEIRIADGKGDWGYPNPYRHYPRGPGYIRMSWVFDTLVWKDEKGYVPALAKSWRFDEREMSYLFELQPNAKWHDGTPVTSDDVVFTISYYQKHPYGWVSMKPVDRGEAIDGNTMKIFLKKPYSPFLSDIAGTMPILPKHIWENVVDPRKYMDSKSFIGSGPYKFIDFNNAKGTYLYEAFDDYYQGKPRANRLIYVKSAGLMALTTGKADVANVKPEMVPMLTKKGMKVLVSARGWNKKLMINHRIAPFGNRAFRQAMSYAIDRQEIIDKAHRGHGTPASYGLLSKDHEWYNPATPDYPHNPEKARRILETLGYQKDEEGYYSKDGKPLRIELIASSISVVGEKSRDRDGEVIKRQLEAVGMRVNLAYLEQVVTDSRVNKWEFQLAISGHGLLLGDPKILREMISSQQGAGSVNSSRFDANPELNRLLEEQLGEMNRDKRKQLVFRIQEIYANELPAISLYYPKNMSSYDPAKGITWFYTKGGIAKGIPIVQNKMALVR